MNRFLRLLILATLFSLVLAACSEDEQPEDPSTPAAVPTLAERATSGEASDEEGVVEFKALLFIPENAPANLFLKEETDKAIALFRLNVDRNPESHNVYDSLADGLLAKGEKEEAIKK